MVGGTVAAEPGVAKCFLFVKSVYSQASGAPFFEDKKGTFLLGGELLRFKAHLTSSPIIRIRLQQMPNKVLRILAHFAPILSMKHHLRTAAFLNQIIEVFAAERRVTAEQRVGDDAQRPHVDRFAVAFLKHHFGGGVAEGTGHGGENFVFGVEHFGDTEVSEDEVAVGLFG